MKQPNETKNGGDNSCMMAIISRKEIEAGDIGGAIDALDKLQVAELEKAGVQRLLKLKSRIGFKIDGYQDDPRAHILIPEIRDYFQKLHSVWPYGIYFFERESGTLPLLVYSHVEMKPLLTGGKFQHATPVTPFDDVTNFIQTNLIHIFQIYQQMGWNTDQIPEQMEGLMSGLMKFFAVRENLPALVTVSEAFRRRHKFEKSESKTLSDFARHGHREVGRGAVVAGAMKPGDADCEVIYLNHERLFEIGRFKDFRLLHQLVQAYNPETEYVFCYSEATVPRGYILSCH